MFSLRQPAGDGGLYPSYLDREYPPVKENLKNVYRHTRKICRTLVNRASNQDPTFLIYHSVSDTSKGEFVYPPCTISAELFEAQIRHAVDHYKILSIDEYLEFIENQIVPPRRSLLVSFDDGYLDNLDVAFPILAKYNVPAIIYLATRYIDEAEAQWVDRMYNIFKYRNTQNVTIDFLSRKNWNMENRTEQRALFSYLNELLITMTYEERARILECLSNSFQYEGDIPRLTLNWNEVKQITEKFPNITLGIHTDQHLDVRTHKNELQQEVEISFNKISNATNIKPKHFSFPYERAFEGAHKVLLKSGIKSAVCHLPQFKIRPEQRQYYMARVDAVKYPMHQWWYVKQTGNV